MKMGTLISRFWKEKGAAATVEFVVLFLPMIALVFTCFQVALAYHFSLTAQKAVEVGARVAAVRDPVYKFLPGTNETAPGQQDGEPCAFGNCVNDTTIYTCEGANLSLAECDVEAFNAIFQEVAAFAYLLQPEDMNISYQYARLGKARGPFTPLITVSIVERPFTFQFGFDLGFGRRQGDPQSQEVQTQIGISAIAVAEDMSSAN